MSEHGCIPRKLGMDTEIWISSNFHVTQCIMLDLIFSNYLKISHPSLACKQYKNRWWVGLAPDLERTRQCWGAYSGRLSGGVTEGPGKDLDRTAVEVRVWGEQAGHQLKGQQVRKTQGMSEAGQEGRGELTHPCPICQDLQHVAPVLYCQHAHFSDIQSFERRLDYSERKYGKTNKQTT